MEPLLVLAESRPESCLSHLFPVYLLVLISSQLACFVSLGCSQNCQNNCIFFAAGISSDITVASVDQKRKGQKYSSFLIAAFFVKYGVFLNSFSRNNFWQPTQQIDPTFSPSPENRRDTSSFFPGRNSSTDPMAALQLLRWHNKSFSESDTTVENPILCQDPWVLLEEFFTVMSESLYSVCLKEIFTYPDEADLTLSFPPPSIHHAFTRYIFVPVTKEVSRIFWACKNLPMEHKVLLAPHSKVHTWITSHILYFVWQEVWGFFCGCQNPYHWLQVSFKFSVLMLESFLVKGTNHIWKFVAGRNVIGLRHANKRKPTCKHLAVSFAVWLHNFLPVFLGNCVLSQTWKNMARKAVFSCLLKTGAHQIISSLCFRPFVFLPVSKASTAPRLRPPPQISRKKGAPEA